LLTRFEKKKASLKAIFAHTVQLKMRIMNHNQKFSHILLFKKLFLFRFSSSSCTGLEPEYMHEDYSGLKLGPSSIAHVPLDDGKIQGSPKKLNTRQVPFSIEFEFNEYRANKKYEGKI